MEITPTKNETKFILSYLACIDFTEALEGEELDEIFERESIIDCLAFYTRIECYLSDDTISQAGHDFWLTRNGHGTGFWDRDCYGPHKDMFTTIAESFGEAHAIGTTP